MDEQERYAAVKRVFLSAVELSSEERKAYLDKHCPVRTDIRRSVEGMLSHYDSQTLIDPRAEGQNTQVPSPSYVLDQYYSLDEARDAASPQFYAELSELLRWRLKGLAALLSLLFVFSLSRSLITGFWPVQAFEVVLMIPVLVSWRLLASQHEYRIGELRTIEAVMMTSLCLLLVNLDVSELLRGAQLRDESIVVGANARSQLSWCMTIMLYGIFVPSRWQRAAWILILVACIPHVTVHVVRWWNPFVRDVLDLMDYTRPIPPLLLAVFSAVFAVYFFQQGWAAKFRIRQFAQYRLGELLGEGGMGRVYTAEHSMLKRPCALKVVREERGRDPVTLDHFRKEVQAAAMLTHPNTIRIHDYGQTINGTFFYVMELLRGMPLDKMVAEYGPLPSNRAVYLLRQACGALQEAHDAGLVHRDVKPSNLFASEQGGEYDVMKVLDFGLVGAVSEATRLSDIAGTPAFMPPEQGLGAATVDARSDIYALGASAYYLITGTMPFRAPSAQLQLIAHLSDPVDPPSTRYLGVANDLERVVLRCLEKSRPDRYQTMRELSDALAQCDCGEIWTNEDAAEWWSHIEPNSG